MAAEAPKEEAVFQPLLIQAPDGSLCVAVEPSKEDECLDGEAGDAAAEEEDEAEQGEDVPTAEELEAAQLLNGVSRTYYARLYLTRKRSFLLLVAFDVTYFTLLLSARFVVRTTGDNVPYSFGYNTEMKPVVSESLDFITAAAVTVVDALGVVAVQRHIPWMLFLFIVVQGALATVTAAIALTPLVIFRVALVMLATQFRASMTQIARMGAARMRLEGSDEEQVTRTPFARLMEAGLNEAELSLAADSGRTTRVQLFVATAVPLEGSPSLTPTPTPRASSSRGASSSGTEEEEDGRQYGLRLGSDRRDKRLTDARSDAEVELAEVVVQSALSPRRADDEEGEPGWCTERSSLLSQEVASCASNGTAAFEGAGAGAASGEDEDEDDDEEAMERRSLLSKSS
mmetsp:Transcript_2616/g.9496  ORF Transcript_2616/g.9496 Transcript_2616/m.9496 type:complete len:400 (+) Transcript_2616:203-1402(+)